MTLLGEGLGLGTGDTETGDTEGVGAGELLPGVTACAPHPVSTEAKARPTRTRFMPLPFRSTHPASVPVAAERNAEQGHRSGSSGSMGSRKELSDARCQAAHQGNLKRPRSSDGEHRLRTVVDVAADRLLAVPVDQRELPALAVHIDSGVNRVWSSPELAAAWQLWSLRSSLSRSRGPTLIPQWAGPPDAA